MVDDAFKLTIDKKFSKEKEDQNKKICPFPNCDSYLEKSIISKF